MLSHQKTKQGKHTESILHSHAIEQGYHYKTDPLKALGNKSYLRSRNDNQSIIEDVSKKEYFLL